MGKRTNTATWLEKYNRWQINVQKDGERRSFTSSTPGRTGQREANRKADEWLDKDIDKQNVKVSILFSEWIEELKITTGTSHWKQYEKFGRVWMIPEIGHKKAGVVMEQHLQNIILNAHKKGLAKKTLSGIRACILAFLKYLRKSHASTLHPEELYVPKNAPEGERIILQPNDLKLLFTNDNTIMRKKSVPELYINAYRYEVVTGLRPGEVIGLNHTDITKNSTNISRSINAYQEETKGKNKNAVRKFVNTPLALDILERQKKLLKELGIISPHVFPDMHGGRIGQGMYYQHWIRYRDAAGISAKASPYELRHTFVSIVKRLPEGLLKQLVGHSKDMDTHGVYSHEVEGDHELTSGLVYKMFLDVLADPPTDDKELSVG